MSVSSRAYPVQLSFERAPTYSRLLIFVKWLLVIPHYIALMFLGIGAWMVIIVSWFAVLITGRYPRGMFDYMVGVQRWGLRAGAYYMLLTDKYPPFSLQDDPSYPVHFDIEYPERIARWRPLVHWLLVIPAYIVAVLMLYVAFFVDFLAWFAILITGRFPDGLFNIVTVALRWQANVVAYAYWMTDRYPSLAWQP